MTTTDRTGSGSRQSPPALSVRFIAETQMESETLSPTLRERIIKAGLNRWKLETLTGLMGIRALQAHQKMSQRNQEAENRAVREKLWGNNGDTTDGDDMGHTILGDVTNPAPIVVNQPSGGSFLKAAAAVALGAAVPGGFIAGWLLNDGNKTEITSPGESVNLGLGRIEDFLSQ